MEERQPCAYHPDQQSNREEKGPPHRQRGKTRDGPRGIIVSGAMTLAPTGVGKRLAFGKALATLPIPFLRNRRTTLARPGKKNENRNRG